MPVETQFVTIPTYVSYGDLEVVYSGDKKSIDDYDVTNHMHPHDGLVYKYIPEEKNWEPSMASAWAKVRAERDKRIEAFRWKIDRERDLLSLNLSIGGYLTVLLTYVQALRDIPQTQTDPFNIVWPDEPA
jgi:hypothetical protein